MASALVPAPTLIWWLDRALMGLRARSASGACIEVIAGSRFKLKPREPNADVAHVNRHRFGYRSILPLGSAFLQLRRHHVNIVPRGSLTSRSQSNDTRN
jgi:hypothetical protein